MSLTEVKDTLLRLKRQGKPEVQIKILLRGKTKEATVKINEFLLDTEIDPETKLNLAVEALTIIANIEQNLPRSDQFAVPRMKYSAIGNFIRSHIVVSYSHSNIARNYTSASILSNLLMDQIIHIDELPQLPSYQEPEIFNRSFGPIFNVIVSTAGVYNSLISTLPVFGRNDLQDWIEKIFHNLKLFEELRSRFNILALLSSWKISDLDKYFNNIFNIANTHFTTVDYTIQMYRLYGGEIPAAIQQMDIFGSGSLPEFTQYVGSILQSNQAFPDDIKRAKREHYIPVNADYTSVMFYPFYQLNMKQVTSFLTQLEIYNSGIWSAEGKITQYIGEMEETLTFLEGMIGSKKELVDSGLISSLQDNMKYYIPFLALHAVQQQDPQLFDKFDEDWQYFIEKHNFQHDNEIAFLYLLSSLFVKTNLQLPVDYLGISQTIEKNLDYVTLRPRMFVSFVILKLIMDLYLGKPILANQELVNQIYQIGVPEVHSWYREDLEAYLSYLRGETKEILLNRIQPIPLETYSWLIPDFTSKPLTSGQSIQYLPFNRRLDSVID